MTQYDVVVVGPGPAGSSCAHALARLGLRVALFGPLATEPHRVGEVINSAVAQGIHFAGADVRYVASAWLDELPDVRDIKLMTGRAATVAARPDLDQRLLSDAIGAGVRYDKTRVLSCRRVGPQWQIGLSGSSAPIAANFIVEATGRRVASVALAGATRQFFDNLFVLWCLATSDGSEISTLSVVPCEHGWWYSVPIGRGWAFLALATDADLMPPSELPTFFERCAVATPFWSMAKRRLEQPKVTDARTSFRIPQSAPGWIPIGDAAFSIDPLSGDGVARARADGELIAHALASREHQIDAGLEFRDVAAERAGRFLHQLSLQASHYAAVSQWGDKPFWSRRKPK